MNHADFLSEVSSCVMCSKQKLAKGVAVPTKARVEMEYLIEDKRRFVHCASLCSSKPANDLIEGKWRCSLKRNIILITHPCCNQTKARPKNYLKMTKG